MRIQVILRDRDSGIETRPGNIYCNPISHKPITNVRLPMTITQGPYTWTIEDPDVAEAIYFLPSSFRAIRHHIEQKGKE